MLDGALHRLRSIRLGSSHLKPASAPSVHGLMVDLSQGGAIDGSIREK
jgi:hypothetical protein